MATSLPSCNFMIFFVISSFSLDTASGQRMCIEHQARANYITVDHDDDPITGGILVQGSNVVCPKGSDHCYTSWYAKLRDGTLSSITVSSQGCWQSSGSIDCEKEECRAIEKSRERIYFCCCKGDLCNRRVYQGRVKDDFTPNMNTYYTRDRFLNISILLVCIVILTFIVGYYLWQKKSDSCVLLNSERDAGLLDLEESRDHSGQSFKVVLLTLIDKGKYSTVRLGCMDKEQFAVKSFTAENKRFFSNERDIYNLPFMSHPSFLKYYGHDFFKTSSGVVYSNFLSYAPKESLQRYLKQNVVDWETFCKMSLSIASGLSHLHTSIQKDGLFKPSIAHRDLNSMNIVVQSDLTCVICDFCLATQINGSRYRFNGEERHAEKKSINDVGTLRYMSPEVLEGAVNLSDCESALKQIDVYASGLIYWELARRCSGFYPSNVECEPYQLPFETEAGQPTLEDMKTLVCYKKMRPSFPKLWCNTTFIQTVKETIEECWDHDAEARLTAVCVEERFRDLNYINGTSKLSVDQSDSVRSFPIPSHAHKNFQIPVVIGHGKDGDSCMSESTVETLVAVTPANPLVPWKNLNQYKTLSYPQQSRNTCLEPYLVPENDGSDGCLYMSRKPGLFVGHSTPSDPVPKASQVLKNAGKSSKWSARLQSIVSLWKLKGKEVQSPLTVHGINKFHHSTGPDLETSPVQSNFVRSTFAGVKRPNTLDLTQKRRDSNRRPSDNLPLINGDDVVPLRERKCKNSNVDVLAKHGAMTKRKTVTAVENLKDGECQNRSSNASSLTKSIEEIFTMERKNELKDPSQRIKTPGDIPIADRRIRSGRNAERLSLYDDRMMTGHYDEDMTFVYLGEKHLKSLEP